MSIDTPSERTPNSDGAGSPGADAGRGLLLRGGWVVSVDPAVGVLRGDVLVVASRIAAIGTDLPAGNARIVDATDRIVMPGLVDVHRHTWQSAVRHVGGDWDIGEYFTRVFFGFGPRYRPEDVYAGNLLGRLAALDAGITTMLDWSHIQNSPAHSDAAVQALLDAGGRSVFAYGWPQTDPAAWTSASTLTVPEDVARVRRDLLPTDDALVTMAMALRGSTFSTRDVARHDVAVARDLGLRMTFHTGPTHPEVLALEEDGLLGADMTFVHSDSTDEELRLIAASGATAAVSPLIEMTMAGIGVPATGRLLAAGIRPALSVDSETATPGDLFAQLRATLAAARLIADHEFLPAPLGRPSVADVLSFATFEGARALGMEDRIGSITVGKQADLVLLRADDLALHPVTDPTGAIVLGGHPGLIDAVVVAGQVVKEHGELYGPLARARDFALASQRHLLEKE